MVGQSQALQSLLLTVRRLGDSGYLRAVDKTEQSLNTQNQNGDPGCGLVVKERVQFKDQNQVDKS